MYQECTAKGIGNFIICYYYRMYSKGNDSSHSNVKYQKVTVSDTDDLKVETVCFHEKFTLC